MRKNPTNRKQLSHFNKTRNGGWRRAAARPTANVQIKEADISKFEQHFSKLFDEANLPGPNYYEFWKMMDTLEAHIPAEGERMNAVFASLKVQGLSKEVLLTIGSAIQRHY